MSESTFNRGRIGEEMATRFLQKGGFKIVERNYRARAGEIDIIARDGQTLVFVEVKAGRNRGFGVPKEWVDGRKRRRIAQVAMAYIQDRQVVDTPCRFDVVAVDRRGAENRIEHIRNAFQVESV